MSYVQGYWDINVIPDKYNTGANESLVNTTLAYSDFGSNNIISTNATNGYTLKFKKVSGWTSLAIDFQYINQDIPDMTVIENTRFVGGLGQFNLGGTGKTIVFRNCIFDGNCTLSRLVTNTDSSMKFRFENCTIHGNTGGCNAYFFKCKIGHFTGDATNPMAFITYKDCYIYDIIQQASSGIIHCDGSQMFGIKNNPTYCLTDINYDNVRMEIPPLKYDGQANGVYVNSCFTVGAEYAAGLKNSTIKNCIVNGGGYAFYVATKELAESTNLTIENITIDNNFIGYGSRWGNLYTCQGKPIHGNITMTNTDNYDKLLVSTVSKTDNKITVTVTNDTNVEKALIVVTNKETKTFSIPAYPNGKSLTSSIKFEDLPIDLQYEVTGTDYVVCYDTVISDDNQIRYVRFIDESKIDTDVSVPTKTIEEVVDNTPIPEDDVFNIDLNKDRNLDSISINIPVSDSNSKTITVIIKYSN